MTEILVVSQPASESLEQSKPGKEVVAQLRDLSRHPQLQASVVEAFANGSHFIDFPLGDYSCRLVYISIEDAYKYAGTIVQIRLSNTTNEEADCADIELKITENKGGLEYSGLFLDDNDNPVGYLGSYVAISSDGAISRVETRTAPDQTWQKISELGTKIEVALDAQQSASQKSNPSLQGVPHT